MVITLHKAPYMLFVLICFISSCASSDSNQENLNTYKQSELAMLMRIMESHGDETRKAIRIGAELPPRPSGIVELIQATPSEGMHINESTFPIFVKQYQEQIDALYSASIDNQTSTYNALIQTCRNCHVSHCPGPLMKIEKMFIN